MADNNLQGLVISLALFGLCISLFFTTIGYLAIGFGGTTDDVYNTNQINSSIMEAKLRNFTSATDTAEESAFEQKATEYQEGYGFNIIDSAKTLWFVIKSVPATTGSLLYNIFGIPAWIIFLAISLIIMLGVIYIYLLARGVV